jgi:hypothetical protein
MDVAVARKWRDIETPARRSIHAAGEELMDTMFYSYSVSPVSSRHHLTASHI